jgi:hypothetical protein
VVTISSPCGTTFLLCSMFLIVFWFWLLSRFLFWFCAIFSIIVYFLTVTWLTLTLTFDLGFCFLASGRFLSIGRLWLWLLVGCTIFCVSLFGVCLL